jgi:hypothetical protein
MTRYLTRDAAAVAAAVLGPLALAAVLLPARGSWPNTNVALLLVAAVVAVACLGNRLAVADAGYFNRIMASAALTQRAGTPYDVTEHVRRQLIDVLDLKDCASSWGSCSASHRAWSRTAR